MRNSLTSAAAAFERRASRAVLLAREDGPAREALRFAAHLLGAQAKAVLELEFAHQASPLTGRLDEDGGRLLPVCDGLLASLAVVAPAELASEVRELRAGEARAITARLAAFWNADDGVDVDFLARALLRPYVAVLASLGIPPHRPRAVGRCPFCGGRAALSVRKELPETHGAQRSLVCGLCGGEWPFTRVTCPACFEGSPDRLPSYKNDRHPAALIEACETCGMYVKAIDLTRDARPEPEVDDLLSLSLDLWAVEQGYTRAAPGLAGI